MTFDNFLDWCEDRCRDGCWNIQEAITCYNIITTINKLPFWKRKKAWWSLEYQVMNEIIIPTSVRYKIWRKK